MAGIRRVLVANRGEIAVRVMRTCRDMGIETVAVFSDVDRVAPHVLMADYAVHIGASPASESYLVVEKLLAACRSTGADAVHPGYGFLSENAAFAKACHEAGITFIGPPIQSILTMGSKTEARAAALAAELPLVPGDSGPEGRGFDDASGAEKVAEKIGFPVLIKAAAGGGGKGMRLVESAVGFSDAFDGAKREAKSAFGDDTVYVEKAVLRPRHVEIQVFADTHGNVVHLGDRDCSVQRRHQKVIEEAPCPAVGEGLRRDMGAAAVRIAKACDYVGAGTVEFLVDDAGAFYFLEMNTRLQVEHPVTELIYGLDLVSWQIRVARGEPLPKSQDELDKSRRGVAMECRVYAEDPARFLPSSGKITHLRVPNGPYVRDDSGAYEGFQISMFYDPLISKLVVWGADREEAVGRMRRALLEYEVRGIATNLRFHRRVFGEKDFVAGTYHTGYIGEHPELTRDTTDSSKALEVAAVAEAIRHSEKLCPVEQPEEAPSAWSAVSFS